MEALAEDRRDVDEHERYGKSGFNSRRFSSKGAKKLEAVWMYKQSSCCEIRSIVKGQFKALGCFHKTRVFSRCG